MRSGGKRVSFDQLIELPAAALGFSTMPAKRSKSYRLRSTLRMATFANTAADGCDESGAAHAVVSEE